ncbi:MULTISPECIES: TRAP transporter substrate-binding protein [unclassified Polaromonas]|uniref:TRAP transporter substrate-binding protein n=1 Tax=unclassified Polaromonas TaxID=2638319 RepID=UPI000F07428A|nr:MULTISPECIES: TRAP transporter substrate-binding protein DctP [unclassified Polaromonas]AYQ27756.1 ABC transporter substrate-binding protein [Polaromonas sp. SP1]QGJ17390.1 ABC transporter substrate-binding protein [Polaromonas sp. Pch-P]
MQRRRLLSAATVGAAAATMAAPSFAQSQPVVRWRMPSSFPKALTTVFGGAQSIATLVSSMTDGKFTITPFGAGEVVPPLAVLDAVQNNTTECGHTAGFYYIGKEPALVFDTGVPFGMGPRQHDAWMNHGGGLELMGEIYNRFNVVQIPCGNTGAQMGGWFRKEIKTPEDFKGLRIRAAGFLGHVYAKLGATPQQIPASDIYPALEKGVIDAVEWVGPYDDEKLGLNKVAKYYYAPGVLERGASLCFIVNKTAWAGLPPGYQAVLKAACAQSATDMLAKYDALNIPALKRLIGGGAKLGYWSKPIMEAMQKASNAVMQEQSAANETFRKVHTQWKAFLDEQILWSSINDGAAEQFLTSSQRKRS